MKLSLDTDVAVEVIRGRHPHYRVWLEQSLSTGATLHLSSVVFHDLMFAAMTSDAPEQQMERVDALTSQMEVHAWTPDDAVEAARIRADLRRSGSELRGMDALIAGQAINGDWTLVSGNLRDFIRVPNLKLLDWSDPAGPLDRGAAWMRLIKRPAK